MLAIKIILFSWALQSLVGNGERKMKSKNKCKPKNLAKASIETSDCFERDFKLLYLEANNLLVKSSPVPTQESIVGKALGLSKRKNLTAIQLKVLTDVVHHQVKKKPLLNSKGPKEGQTQSTRHYDVVALGSDILHGDNMETLEELSEVYPVGERLLYDFDEFAKKKMEELQEESYISKAENIEFEASPCNKISSEKGYQYRSIDENETGIRDANDRILLAQSAFFTNESKCAISAIYFKTLQRLLPSNNSIQFQQNATNSTRYINSRIIALSTLPDSNNNLSQPVKITLNHLGKETKFEQKGFFWRFENGYEGYWSDAGCDVIHQTDQATTFECNHLTNFAILVTGQLKSRNISDVEYSALSTISTVGCFLSMIGEIATLAVYAVTKVQSKRRFILINVVLCLVLAQAIFLAGIEQAGDRKVVCAFVAALISYFFLASFFWMLNMGIHLYMITSRIFSIHFPIWYFMISGYVIPLAEICLAAAITHGHGFGTSQFCWLSSENGTVWIFTGPVTLITVLNIGITTIVLLRMLKTRKLQDARTFQKAKNIIRAIIILTPSLGLTWLFGIFTVATHDVIMQFIFASLNSFQGIFILITCCILDKKVREEFFGLIRHPKRLSSRAALRKIEPMPNQKSKYLSFGN